MKRQFSKLAVVSALGTLLGCAQLGTQGPASAGVASTASDTLPVKVASVPAAVRLTAAPGAESAYLMGRAAHGAGQLTQARTHYAQVLELEPRHVGALNAMAVIHAQEGSLDDALKLFGEAMAVAPQAAHLHNNAGYALLRAGRLDEAEVALLKARHLDPGNPQVGQNLSLLRAAQARAPSTQQTSAPQVQIEVQDQAAGPRVVPVAPQVYALQSGAGSSSEAPTAALTLPVAAVLPTTTSLRGVRVEVSNGVGTSRLARRTANRLAPTGLVTARLTNAKPYRQATTEIQFGAGQEQLAQALSTHLPVAAKMVASNSMQPGIQMRLVLGHDLTGKAIAAWLEGVDHQHASWHRGERWVWGS